MKLIAVALAVAVTLPVHAQKKPLMDVDDIVVGSYAELWRQRSFESKVGYLEGMCEGMRGAEIQYLWDLLCRSPLGKFDASNKPRFCGLSIYPEKSVAYMDEFYKDRNHSDLPVWVAIGAYIDKACGAANVTPRMAKLQTRNRCYRALSNMDITVAKSVRDAQEAECRKLPE